VQAGRPGDAESAVAEFAEWTSGGAAEWALLDFARCRALLDDGQAERWHREAFELAARVGRLATSARVELSYGSWLRRRKRYQEARPHLRVAKDFFHRLAASPWRDRAHAELRAAGETGSTARRVASALTAQELRIAREAAAGRTNREIAASLGLSPRTVGYHLYKIFPKLDITSRTQLPRALSSVDPEAPSRESGLSAH
jgi:DNA-binding CsgD family transcriptional regulator